MKWLCDVEWEVASESSPCNGTRCVVLCEYRGERGIAISWQDYGEWRHRGVKLWVWVKNGDEPCFPFEKLPKKVLVELVRDGDADFAWPKKLLDSARRRRAREEKAWRGGGNDNNGMGWDPENWP